MRWPWFRRACLIGALLPALAVPLTGHAQVDSREAIALQNQIYQLRQTLDILHAELARVESATGGGGPASGGPGAAELLPRVQAIEEQLRQLRGAIDETQNLVNRQSADLSKRIDDLTFQLNMGKSGGSTSGAASGPAPPPPREVPPPPDPGRTANTGRPPPFSTTLPSVTPPPSGAAQSFTFNQTPVPMREPPRPPATPPAKPPQTAQRPAPPPEETKPSPATEVAAAIPPGGKRTPELALQEGHAALARRDYAAAERAAREVMANRTSPRAYDGQFLLAEALAGEKQYAQAAIAYDDAYNRAHKGRHAQEAMVGLAGSLTAINEKKAACDTLNRMRTEFPEVRADLRDSITRTNERAGCGK